MPTRTLETLWDNIAGAALTVEAKPKPALARAVVFINSRLVVMGKEFGVTGFESKVYNSLSLILLNQTSDPWSCNKI